VQTAQTGPAPQRRIGTPRPPALPRDRLQIAGGSHLFEEAAGEVEVRVVVRTTQRKRRRQSTSLLSAHTVVPAPLGVVVAGDVRVGVHPFVYARSNDAVLARSASPRIRCVANRIARILLEVDEAQKATLPVFGSHVFHLVFASQRFDRSGHSLALALSLALFGASFNESLRFLLFGFLLLWLLFAVVGRRGQLVFFLSIRLLFDELSGFCLFFRVFG